MRLWASQVWPNSARRRDLLRLVRCPVLDGRDDPITGVVEGKELAAAFDRDAEVVEPLAQDTPRLKLRVTPRITSC